MARVPLVLNVLLSKKRCYTRKRPEQARVRDVVEIIEMGTISSKLERRMVLCSPY